MLTLEFFVGYRQAQGAGGYETLCRVPGFAGQYAFLPTELRRSLKKVPSGI